MLEYASQSDTAKKEPQSVRDASCGIRVLLLDFWCFIPYYMAELAKGLNGLHVDARVLASTYRFDPGFFARNGLRNNPGFLDLVSKWNIGSAWLRQPLKLFEYCCNLLLLSLKLPFSRPDIIHVQYLALLSIGLPLELIPLKIGRACGTRIVCTVHNLLPHDTGGRHRKVFQRLYSMADSIICHNSATADRLTAEFGIAAGRIQVIPHGPLQPMERPLTQSEARNKLQLPADRRMVLWQGVIGAYKGIDFLLDAWKLVEPGALLFIAGTGDPRLIEQLRERVAGMERDDVRLDLFFIPPELLPLYFRAADVVVYPYRQITTSGAMMTGLGHGKAIIATRLPTFTEMLEDEKEALLVPYGDTAALAHAMERLIHDAALRGRLEMGASNVAAQFSWSQIAARTRACYEHLISKIQ
jgi:glycosyltransferase involved in cell wall biosynthesis